MNIEHQTKTAPSRVPRRSRLVQFSSWVLTVAVLVLHWLAGDITSHSAYHAWLADHAAHDACHPHDHAPGEQPDAEQPAPPTDQDHQDGCAIELFSKGLCLITAFPEPPGLALETAAPRPDLAPVSPSPRPPRLLPFACGPPA